MRLIVFILISYFISGCQVISEFTQNEIAIKLPNKIYKGLGYKRIIINDLNEAWIVSKDNNKIKSTWYSGDMGVIKFKNSRLVSYLVKTPHLQYLEKTSDAINWQQISNGYAQKIKKCIIVINNNEISYCDVFILQRKKNYPRIKNFQGNPEKFIWIHEKQNRNSKQWKEIWYAYDNLSKKIVFAKMCLDKTNCISWQNWNFR